MSVRLAFCGLDEVDELVAFLRDHWGRDHVLVTDRRVLDRQHRDEVAGRYDAMIAWDGDEIVGVLGFIRTGRLDPELDGDRDTLWLTTWRARDDAPPGTGIALVRALERALPYGWIGTVGMRADAEPLYRGLGYRAGVLDRWVLVNPDVELRLIRSDSGGPLSPSLLGPRPSIAPATPLTPLAADELADPVLRRLVDHGSTVPARSVAHSVARFVDDPFYRYEFRLATGAGRGVLLVTRLVEHAGARAVRIVSIVGHPLAAAGIGPALLELLREHRAEYLDLYATGFSEELESAGLRPLTGDLGMVVPSRFDPFERRPSPVRYAVKGRGGPLLLGKADADQDRPNRAPGGASTGAVPPPAGGSG